MSLTILASVSLLALVSARPIQQSYHTRTDSVQSILAEDNEEFRQIIQTVVRTHASVTEEVQVEGDIEVQLTTVEQVQSFLSEVHEADVKAVIPLNHELAHFPDEQEPNEVLAHFEEGQLMQLPDDAIDRENIELPIASSDGLPGPDEDEMQSLSNGEIKLDSSLVFEGTQVLPEPHFVITASCALALTAVVIIAIILYLVGVLQLRALETMKDFMPYLHMSFTCPQRPPELFKDKTPHLIHRIDEKHSTEETLPESDSGQMTPDERRSRRGTTLTSLDSSSTSEGLLIVIDELHPPTLENSATSPCAASACVTAHHSPAISAKETSLTPDDLSISVPGGLPMRELELPMWFTRASEASALARASDECDRRSGYGQYTVPGLDAALAMQLRPGYGLSGDIAWLVRFVMALFGWCAVLMSSSNNYF